MRIILFGGSGMVGQGVLRVVEADAAVTEILLIVREPLENISAKTTQLIHKDFFDWRETEDRFRGFDACYFCLGVSSVGMKEPEYRRTTYDLTLAAAETVARAGVHTFIYISGANTNANGKQMWARVKGETENALMELPFQQLFNFRPGFIQAAPGVKSKVPLYNALYVAVAWAYPLIRKLFRGFTVDWNEIGKAMLAVTRNGYPKRILEVADIQAAASTYSSTL